MPDARPLILRSATATLATLDTQGAALASAAGAALGDVGLGASLLAVLVTQRARVLAAMDLVARAQSTLDREDSEDAAARQEREAAEAALREAARAARAAVTAAFPKAAVVAAGLEFALPRDGALAVATGRALAAGLLRLPAAAGPAGVSVDAAALAGAVRAAADQAEAALATATRERVETAQARAGLRGAVDALSDRRVELSALLAGVARLAGDAGTAEALGMDAVDGSF